MDSGVLEILAHSDMLPESLLFVRESFLLAHDLAPGGLSVEVGTRKGGSALLQLRCLAELYPETSRPFLFTVDPYGGKPYRGGDRIDVGLYGDVEYLSMKKLLAGFPNHVHWYMESLTFFALAPAIEYWSRSNQLPVKDLSFVLLDGDHDAETIAKEVASVLPLMHPAGIIVVDNFDKDSRTPSRLGQYANAIKFGPPAPPGALQLRIHVNQTR